MLLLIFFSVPADARASSSAAPRQAVVVKTSAWTARQGTLQRYARSSPDGDWQPEGEVIPIVAGRSGMGWGAGLHEDVDHPEPQKREGDGRSPAGIFKLGRAFGYAPADQADWIKLPYLSATSLLRCVDDPRSPHYNRIVDAGVTRPDWKSDEEMLRGDNQYRLGIIVDYNVNPVVPGRGSCIFMHIWKSSETPTAGCTAMSQENMETLLSWLDPAANPVLVQLPAPIYMRLRPVWDLP